MKLKSLEIRRTESYQTPANALVGTVNLLDEGGGAMTIVLSAQSIIKICDLLQAEVTQRAAASARLAQSSMRDASAELALSSHPMLSVEEDQS